MPKFNKISEYSFLRNCCLTIILVSVICSFLSAFLALHQSPGIGDESFYWYLISSQRTASLTWFNKYMSLVKDFSLTQLRALGYVLSVICGLILGESVILSMEGNMLFRFSRLEKITILAISGCSAFLIRPHESLLPSYVSMNLYISCLGISFLILGVYKYNNVYPQSLCFFVSGLIMSQLCFIMPTTSITLIYFFMLLFLFSKKNKCFSFIIGVLCVLVFLRPVSVSVTKSLEK